MNSGHPHEMPTVHPIFLLSCFYRTKQLGRSPTRPQQRAQEEHISLILDTGVIVIHPPPAAQVTRVTRSKFRLGPVWAHLQFLELGMGSSANISQVRQVLLFG